MNGKEDTGSDTSIWLYARRRPPTGTVLALFLHVDKVPTGRLKISLTGIVTFKSVQFVSGSIMNNKRKEARKMFVIELLGKAMIIAIISIFGIGSVLLSLENKEF
ncbi:MAG TPA: hypothetical protein PKW72_11305 [Treponemataceae bacterium]|nr:hypothetical protein [Treponemataceae bacterium]